MKKRVNRFSKMRHQMGFRKCEVKMKDAPETQAILI
jgi:hypothetical protein